MLAFVRYWGQLTLPKTVLWCYLVWWLFIVSRHFDPSPGLWLSSLGLSGIIGTALYLSTAYAGKAKTQLDRWQVFRLYLMPFCVSSFAALIKGQGFILVFEPSLAANALGLALCAAFVATVALLQRTPATWRASESGAGADAA
jgi:hypothetical protein